VLSHELRSPLGAILGWASLLQQDGAADAATLKHGLQVIERNTRTQVQLIQDLLEVSRIITGRLRLDMAPVALDEVVGNVLLSMAPTSSAKGVEVSFPRASTQEVQVLGDESRLQQIVWNLISNAVKFTPAEGQVEVRVEHDDSHASVIVRDSGEGIESEFLPYVFDRFRQADSSSTRKHGGLGLGLAIVRHLAEMHGGSVHAESAGVGAGATFTLRLPLRPAVSALADVSEAEPLRRRQESGPALDSTSLSGLRILLVEDGDDARELLAAILRRSGAQVTLADSAQAAMDELTRSVPDVMVSDIGMPGEDGYALLRRVRAWEAEHNRHVPAMALTAYASEQDLARALEAGFGMHLAKPVEPASLVTAVAELARGTQPAPGG
jgi:CheY-like chemotaxis protein/anti-sigma regulatory factor (Ser/Thr protein kinase)